MSSDYDMDFFIDFKANLWFMGTILAHEGRLLEAILKVERGVASRGCGSQPLASGGPVPRPPGTTTWLRGARCTDPEEMPEKEARDPAENRHGGAPRGARPSAEGRRHPAGCLACSVIAGLPGAAAPGAFVGAPPTPHRGGE